MKYTYISYIPAVKDGKVRVVHASYAPPNQVIGEALSESAVTTLSRHRGCVINPIFQNERLVDL